MTSILNEIPDGKKTLKTRIIFLIKLLLTIAAIILVFYQADLSKITSYLKEMDIFLMIAGLIVLNLGQIASAMRMRFYFSTKNVIFGRIFAIILYYVGMLLNMVLPGGIGGDGYKAYYIKKQYNAAFKTSISCIISGRGSGLLQLVTFTLICGFFSPYIMKFEYAALLLITALVVAYLGYYILARYLLKESLVTQLKAAGYSVIIQGSVIVTILLLLDAMDFKQDIIDYIILFQIATIVSILPISVGGIGLREATFFYLAPFFALDPELGVTLSLAYFIINAIASMLGVVAFMFLGKKT